MGKTVEGRTLTTGDVGKPVLAFDPVDDRDDIFTTAPLSSRWQLQLGVRYTF